METVGIVGGLGTETSCTFCFNVNHRTKEITKIQPSLFMDNVAVSREIESEIANGIKSNEMEKLLKESVVRLNKLNPSFIVIPCNTVHIHIEELRKVSESPIHSIIEETAKECSKRGVKSVGILGSTMTVKERLYQEELEKLGIKAVVPNKNDQEFITSSIIRTINLKQTDNDKEEFIKIIDRLKEQGAEAVILGCTDLFLVVDKERSSIPTINSTEVLENMVVNKLTSSTS